MPLATPAVHGAVVAVALLAAATAAEPVRLDVKRAEVGPHQERIEDPYLAPPLIRRILPPLPPEALQAGGVQSIQVNVDGLGQNIADDAANEPSLGVDPTAPNRMVIGWRQFDSIQSNFRQAGYAWSNDGGRSWNAGVHDPGNFRSDPVLGVLSDGTFIYYSLRGNFLCDVIRSSTGGETWDAPIFAYGGDKAWMTVDRTGGSSDGHVYVAWSTAGNPHAPNQFTRSTDGGLSWDDPSLLPSPSPRWGTLAVAADGTLFISGTAGGNMYVMRSTDAMDGGAAPPSFAITEVNLGGQLRVQAGPNPAGLLGQAWIAVDTSGGPHDGNVYVLASVGNNVGDPLDVRFIRSLDGGDTWSSPIRVNDDFSGASNVWQWFGAMSVAPTGRIDATWYDTRGSGDINLARVYTSSSEDGGLTWSQNVAVSPQFDSFVGWPQQNKLGDYTDMTSDALGTHLTYAATFNGEQDVYYMRIGPYDCNGNGVDDEIDLANGDAQDCNGNGIPDSCDIAAGLSLDADRDGVPDECPDPGCPGDADGDGAVNITDLNLVLANFNLAVAPGEDGDVTGDGIVNIDDLNEVLANFDSSCA